MSDIQVILVLVLVMSFGSFIIRGVYGLHLNSHIPFADFTPEESHSFYVLA